MAKTIDHLEGELGVERWLSRIVKAYHHSFSGFQFIYAAHCDLPIDKPFWETIRKNQIGSSIPKLKLLSPICILIVQNPGDHQDVLPFTLCHDLLCPSTPKNGKPPSLKAKTCPNVSLLIFIVGHGLSALKHHLIRRLKTRLDDESIYENTLSESIYQRPRPPLRSRGMKI